MGQTMQESMARIGLVVDKLIARSDEQIVRLCFQKLHEHLMVG